MRKNGFLTFMFALIPGCGLMYLGYMKKGLQVMSIFAASCFLAVVLEANFYFNALMAFFVLLLPIIWFYQMFDSMHSLAKLRGMGSETPLDDEFFIPMNLPMFSPFRSKRIMKVIAGILIFIGVWWLASEMLDNLNYMLGYNAIIIKITNAVRRYAGTVIGSALLIAAGIRLLRAGNYEGDYERENDD